ncbi:unnamed protein product [Mytilus coruscus]|uniref:CCHC-type domain-containing protein n=1 Tax=Mytilus coruscus TaxID=42192 RepID=A0A6J8C1Z8_MYTCO|nr:unnamed protein product [Mytilus coruscus]
MSQTMEQLCKELNQEQIQQLIQSLVCMKSPEIEGQVETHDVNNVNKGNMASYSNALTGKNSQTDDDNDKNYSYNHISQDQINSPNNSQSSDRVKPFFLLDEDVHGTAKPARSLWLTNVEIYKAISLKVHAGCIKDKPIPRDLTIGKYYAKIFHPGQPEFSHFNNSPNSTSLNEKICHKCLLKGHIMQHCPNDWVCKSCNESGHRMMECTKGFSEIENVQENEVNDEHTHSKVPSTQVPIHSDVSDKTVKMKNTSKSDKDGQTMKNTTKTVKIVDSDAQEKTTKSQQSMDKFVKTPSGQIRPDPKARTPPTPPERLHDQNRHNRTQKKQNTGKT